MSGRNRGQTRLVSRFVPLSVVAVSFPLALTGCAGDGDEAEANNDLCTDFINADVNGDTATTESLSIGETGVSWAVVDSAVVDDEAFDRVQLTYGLLVSNDSDFIAEDINVVVDVDLGDEKLSDSFIDDETAAQHLELTIPYILPGEEYPVGGEVLAPAGLDEPSSVELLVELDDDVTWEEPGESDYYQAIDVTEANVDPRSGEIQSSNEDDSSDNPGWEFAAHTCYEESYLGRVSGVFRNGGGDIIGGVHEHAFKDHPDGSNSSLIPGDAQYSAVFVEEASWESIYRDIDDLHVDLTLYRHG